MYATRPPRRPIQRHELARFGEVLPRDRREKSEQHGIRRAGN
jgi:hypothetical protein